MSDLIKIPFEIDVAPIQGATKSVAELANGFDNLHDTIQSGASDAVVKNLNETLGKTASQMQTVRTRAQELSEQKAMLEQQLAKVSSQFGEESQQAKKLESAILGVSIKIRGHALEMRELTKAAATSDRTMQFLTRTAMSGANAFMMFNMAVGGTDEKSQKAGEEMMRTMGIMQLLMGLTEALTTVRESGGLKNILMTKLDTAAESENIIVKYAAIAAQTALNAVMSLNPFGLVLIALAAIGTAFAAWNNQTKDNIELLQDEIAANDQLAESLKASREMTESVIAADEKLAQARGMNSTQLAELNKKDLQEEGQKLQFEIAIAEESLANQRAINKEKMIDHVSYWGTVGTVLSTGFGLWGNMEDKQKQKIENNNKELKKAEADRLATLVEFQNKLKDIQASILNDDKTVSDAEKKAGEDHKKIMDQRKKEDQDYYQFEADMTQEVYDKALKWQKEDDAKTLKESQDARQYEIDQLKSDNASKVEIINKEREKEIEAAQGDKDKILQIDMKYNAELISLAKETNDKIATDQAAADAKAIAAAEAKHKKIVDTVKVGGQIATDAINLEKQLDTNKTDTQMANLDALHDKKQITDAKYAAEKKKIDAQVKADRKKAAEEEKAVKLAMAIADEAAAILKIMATIPPPANVLPLIETGIMGAIQIATIASAKFAKGTKSAPPGFKLVGEEGPELIYDKGGYPIIPNKETMNILQKWDIPALNPEVFGGKEGFAINNKAVDEAIAVIMAKQQGIDVDALSKKIVDGFGQHLSKEIGQIPESKTVFDEHGFTEYLRTRTTHKTFVKGRF